MKCSACKFWLGAGKNPTVGECHRLPPALVVMPFHTKPAVVTVRWPETLAGSWCGEHMPGASTKEKSR